MLNQLANRAVCWAENHAPIGLRRATYRALKPQRLERIRDRLEGESSDGYSYKPFVKHRCLFVHIPKAAGISVAITLFGCYGGGHTTIGDYQLAFPAEQFRSFYKFTFCRNPWDRLYSAYRFLSGGGMNFSDKAWAELHIARYPTFEQFVHGWVSPRNVMQYHHFRPQAYFLTDPWTGDTPLDFIGRFESIEKDFRHVCQHIPGMEDRTLEHKNKTAVRSSDYRREYTTEMVEKVRLVYRRDVDLLGYDFD